MSKQCRRCLKIKPESEFHKSSHLKDGYQTWCKACINEYKVKWRAHKRTPEQWAEYDRQQRNKKLAKRKLKECSECGTVKPLSEYFQGSTGVITGTRGRCAECQQNWARINGKSQPSPPSPQKKATKAVFDAIQRGDIVRPNICPICGAEPIKRKNGYKRIHFHHTNGYDKDNWFVGTFICARCHAKVHREKVEVRGKQWL